jgi:hypothetical protein
MAVGLAPTIANEVLDAIGNNGSAGTLTGLTEMWIQLHTADPGSAGTTAVAGNATRKLVSFGAASGGVMSNDTAITWTSGEVDTSEDYTHWSGWSASTSGTFIGSGAVTANAVTTGDEFSIPIGDLDLSFTVAA